MTKRRESDRLHAARRLLARHPRHLCLASLVAGLLLSGAGEAAALAAALAVPLAGAFTARAGIAVAAGALLLAGAMVGDARRDAIDRSELSPFIGRSVVMRGHVVRRHRPTPVWKRVRVAVTAVAADVGSSTDAGAWHRLRDRVEVRLPSRERLPELSIGDEVEVRGTLEPVLDRGESGFDYAAYLRRAGVHEVVPAESITPTGSRRGGLTGFVDGLRRRAETGVATTLEPGLGALARGIVLGQDEEISGVVVDRFEDSGLAHLLAVSGQNVVLLAVLTTFVLSLLGLSLRARLGVTLVAIALYVPLAGAGPSILRAGAMGAAATMAALAGRPASRWYALLLACAFTLAIDPRASVDPGWQLSFAAVVGIFTLERPLRKALDGLPAALASVTSLTLSATIATAPLIAFHFDRVSVVSVPANLAAAPAVAPIMWLGTLAGAVAQVAPAPAALLNGVNGFLLAYLDEVARISAGLPGASRSLAIDSTLDLLLSYAVLALAALALGRWAAARRQGAARPRSAPRGRRALAAGALGCLALVAAVVAPSLSSLPAAPRVLTISFLDVGQGDATLIQTPEGRSVLIDAGPPGAGLPGKLRESGVRQLDLAVVTHAQKDHEGGLAEVLRALPVRTVVRGPASGGSGARAQGEVAALMRERRACVETVSGGDVLRIGRLRLAVLSPPGDGLPTRRLTGDDLQEGPMTTQRCPHRVARAPDQAHPADDGEDPNDRALVIVASYGGFDVFLPADAESHVTLGLSVPSVELLKVAHHGSGDDGLPALLERLRPSAAVIEVGADNRFGHPHPKTLAALNARVAHVYRTDRDGDVRVAVRDGGPVVTTGH